MCYKNLSFYLIEMCNSVFYIIFYLQIIELENIFNIYAVSTKLIMLLTVRPSTKKGITSSNINHYENIN
jgi:hypothetical protein